MCSFCQRAKLRSLGQDVAASEGEEDDDFGVRDPSRSKPSDLKRALAALEKLKERLKNYEGQLAVKDQTKDVALGTSKINYMDPRITVAWCKAMEVPLEAVFNKVNTRSTHSPHLAHPHSLVCWELTYAVFFVSCQSLVNKFPWAMEVSADWRF